MQQKLIYTHPAYGDMYYLLNIPQSLEGKKDRPLLIFLHGAGERGKDHELIKVNAVPKLIDEGLELPCVTVCPQCDVNLTWVNEAQFLKAFIDYAVEAYDIDKTRISLTGISMGGYGTWEMLMLYPDFFYKAAPVCGGGTPWRGGLIKTPVWAFHGDADTAVPPVCSYQMVDAVRNAGGFARLTVFHGVGHNSWDEAYGDSRVLAWLTE